MQQDSKNPAISADAIITNLNTIYTSQPLVHNITNFVVMQQTANALLAIGASPIMAHATEEVTEIVQCAQALVLNIGTLENAWIKSMHQALTAAKKRNIPIVLDPVGVGATTFRTHTALDLINSGLPNVIRGNAAEIMALAGINIRTKGVDSQYATEAAWEASQKLSQQFKCVIVVSGATDIVTTSQQQVCLANGVPLMAKITGMGCIATAIIGAFCAVNPDTFAAAAHAMAVIGIAGEIAILSARGPGSFRVNFMDALATLDKEAIVERLKFANK